MSKLKELREDRAEILTELQALREKINDDDYELVRRVLFDADEGRDSLPLISAVEAGILLEFMRDILYQAYVRKGKIQQAMMIRRYMAEDVEEPTPLAPPQRSHG